MKYFFLLFIVFTGYMADGQATFEICVDADKDGNCITKAKEFVIDTGGGTLAFIVKNENGIGTTTLKFKIYRVSSNGAEKFDSEIDAKIEKQDIWAVQDISFYDPGNYKIKVYNWYDGFIASETVAIKRK